MSGTAMIEVECSTCGKSVERRERDAKNRENHFCTTDCHTEYQSGPKELVECNNCGEDINVTPSRYEARENFYCDIDCKFRYIRSQPVNFKLESHHGYPTWTGGENVPVHQLVAISNGCDPSKVFGDGGVVLTTKMGVS